jgi:hypothetical protein
MPGRWTKWWWLSFNLKTWTAEERSIRTELYLAACAVALVLLLTIDPLLEFLGVETHRAATAGALTGMLCCFFSARLVVGILDKNLLRIADQNAEKRLCGQDGRDDAGRPVQ